MIIFRKGLGHLLDFDLPRYERFQLDIDNASGQLWARARHVVDDSVEHGQLPSDVANVRDLDIVEGIRSVESLES